MGNGRYAILVGYRRPNDDGVTHSRRLDVHAPSACEAIAAAARAASLDSGPMRGFEVATVSVLSPDDERELGELEGLGQIS